ncbi:MAG: LysR family transcriptional regulator [Bdellovibrionales bacterium]|nr:LysR family transcriptional regulator [Bdellovibrionales bacterium]
MEKLNHFYEVAKQGSIKEAAKMLNLTQPSVTKSIKILEDSIGKSLFVRKPRGVVLTHEGELLNQYCHVLFSQLEDIEHKLLAPNDPMAGSIKVGTYDSIAIYFWPKFLKRFFKKYPNLDLELTTSRSHNIQKMVEEGELDIGLIIEPKPSTSLEVIDLYEDSFCLYASAKMTNKEINSNSTPLIFMSDAVAGNKKGRLGHLLGEELSQRKHFMTSSLESTKELVINGLGLALLPKLVAKEAVNKKKIKLIEMKSFPKLGIGEHTIGLVYPKHLESSKTLQGLIYKIQNKDWA